MKRRILALLAVAYALGAAAQQPDSRPDLIERIGDGVKGFFNRIFGAPERKPESSPAPSTQAAAPQSPAVSQALHASLARGDYLTALKLIEQGADIEAKDPGAGASALHYAVMRGKMAIIDLLLARGADVNSRSANGSTPLHTAVTYHRLEVAELLIDYGADPNAVNTRGLSPVALADAMNNQPIAGMLRRRGAW